jgi:hypothetical protein
MENKVVGFIPRILFRVFLYLKEKFDPKPEITDEEIYACAICEKLIDNSNSELTYSPLTKKRIIKNENDTMFIVMEGHSINLINHVYSYSVYVQNSTKYFDLCQKFDNVLDEKRKQIETEIRSNIQHSLKTILEKMG